MEVSPRKFGSNVGSIYGSFSLISIFFVYFFVPVLSNRSLEEVDELFQTKILAWKFKNYKCTGIGSHITEVQNINADQLARLKIIGLNPEASSEEHKDTMDDAKDSKISTAANIEPGD